MSLVFSNTTTKNGIIQRIEKTLSFPDAYISGDTTRMAQFTGEVNQGMNKAMNIILQASGKWQFDDSNQTDYPIIKTNIVSGQQDYTFTTDETGNLILDIYRVFVFPTSTATTYQEIWPVDQQSQYTDIGSENPSAVGTPFSYDKTANGIFLDPKPDYNATLGLKMMINRESSYFLTTDTTRSPGFAGLFHEYLVLCASYEYARNKSLAIVPRLERDLAEMGEAMSKYYGRRSRDERNIISGKYFIYE